MKCTSGSVGGSNRLLALTFALGAWLGLTVPPAFGALVFQELHHNGGVGGLFGARSLAVSSDGMRLYVAVEFRNALTIFERNPVSGSLTYADTLVDEENGVDGLAGASGVAVSPDGRHVYVAGAVDNSIAVFARSEGSVEFVELHRDGEGGVEGLAQPRAVTLSSDGRHVYVPSTFDNAVSLFRRDAATGRLTFVTEVRNGEDGVEGLAGAHHLALSPDGANAYVAGTADRALAVFDRDLVTGALSFVQVLRDGVEGVDGLMFASSVAVSPDGGHVYATASDYLDAQGDRAVSVFERDRVTGKLRYIQVLLRVSLGANSVRVSPEGTRVYVGGPGGGIGVYSRDLATGELTLLQDVVEGGGGVAEIGEVFDVTLSADGTYLYAVATGDPTADDGVFAFRVVNVEDICTGDRNGDRAVTIDELVTAVNNALVGCP